MKIQQISNFLILDLKFTWGQCGGGGVGRSWVSWKYVFAQVLQVWRWQLPMPSHRRLHRSHCHCSHHGRLRSLRGLRGLRSLSRLSRLLGLPPRRKLLNECPSSPQNICKMILVGWVVCVPRLQSNMCSSCVNAEMQSQHDTLMYSQSNMVNSTKITKEASQS